MIPTDLDRLLRDYETANQALAGTALGLGSLVLDRLPPALTLASLLTARPFEGWRSDLDSKRVRELAETFVSQGPLGVYRAVRPEGVDEVLLGELFDVSNLVPPVKLGKLGAISLQGLPLLAGALRFEDYLDPLFPYLRKGEPWSYVYRGIGSPSQASQVLDDLVLKSSQPWGTVSKSVDTLPTFVSPSHRIAMDFGIGLNRREYRPHLFQIAVGEHVGEWMDKYSRYIRSLVPGELIYPGPIPVTMVTDVRTLPSDLVNPTMTSLESDAEARDIVRSLVDDLVGDFYAQDLLRALVPHLPLSVQDKVERIADEDESHAIALAISNLIRSMSPGQVSEILRPVTEGRYDDLIDELAQYVVFDTGAYPRSYLVPALEAALGRPLLRPDPSLFRNFWGWPQLTTPLEVPPSISPAQIPMRWGSGSPTWRPVPSEAFSSPNRKVYELIEQAFPGIGKLFPSETWFLPEDLDAARSVLASGQRSPLQFLEQMARAQREDPVGLSEGWVHAYKAAKDIEQLMREFGAYEALISPLIDRLIDAVPRTRMGAPGVPSPVDGRFLR